MMDDARLKRWTIGSLLFVALFAALVSYAHIRTLAIRNGYDPYTASVLPFAVDGLMVGASFMLVTAARAKLKAPLARCALWAGIAATLAANVAYGLPHGLTAASVSAWPGASFILIVEAWMQLAKRQRKATVKKVPAKTKGESTIKLKSSGLTLPSMIQEIGDLEQIAKVNGTYPVPGVKAIKAAIGCGQPRAQKIQDLMKSEHISMEEANERVPRGRPGRRPKTVAVA